MGGDFPAGMGTALAAARLRETETPQTAPAQAHRQKKGCEGGREKAEQ